MERSNSLIAFLKLLFLEYYFFLLSLNSLEKLAARSKVNEKTNANQIFKFPIFRSVSSVSFYSTDHTFASVARSACARCRAACRLKWCGPPEEWAMAKAKMIELSGKWPSSGPPRSDFDVTCN